MFVAVGSAHALGRSKFPYFLVAQVSENPDGYHFGVTNNFYIGDKVFRLAASGKATNLQIG